MSDQSNSRRRPIKNAWEQDAYTPWRKVLFWQRGERKATMRITHKRERREAREEIRRGHS